MMNYEKLKEVNSQLGTVPIKGKDYVPVNEQVRGFRMIHPNGAITTDLSFIADKTCCVKATISDEMGNILSTGYAYEVEGSTFINKTSYIENCETSAVGRALSFLGIGIDQSICSYEEVANAKLNQNNYEKVQTKDAGQLVKELLKVGAEKGFTKDDICKMCKVDSLTELSIPRLEKGIEILRDEKKKDA